jgi:hypothetical protein
MIKLPINWDQHSEVNNHIIMTRVRQIVLRVISYVTHLMNLCHKYLRVSVKHDRRLKHVHRCCNMILNFSKTNWLQERPWLLYARGMSECSASCSFSSFLYFPLACTVENLLSVLKGYRGDRGKEIVSHFMCSYKFSHCSSRDLNKNFLVKNISFSLRTNWFEVSRFNRFCLLFRCSTYATFTTYPNWLNLPTRYSLCCERRSHKSHGSTYITTRWHR